VIYLITGLPGNGKTLYALDWVSKLAAKESRPVFYARIRGVTLPWTLIDPFQWMGCPARSIIVIDECQQSADPSDPKSPSLFGVRQRGAVVPPWAAALETHRHSGVDIVLITQDPMLLDTHDRKLVGVHFHVKRSFGMQRATIHEFAGVKPQVASSTTGSIRHEYSYNKEVFGWYESAEAHTMKRRIPARLVLFLAMPFFLVALVWYLWAYHLDPNREKPGASVVPGAAFVPGQSASGPAPSISGPAGPKEYVASFVPRVPGLEYTAPAYDGITKPTSAPYPAACVSSNGRCTCYSQQATRLSMSDEMCREIVAGGFFTAWSDKAARADRPEPPKVLAAQQQPAKQTRAVVFGGKYAQDMISEVSRTNGGPTGGGIKPARFPDQSVRN